MTPNSRVLRIAQRAFNPYAPGSGTEHVATLLYALTRMTRPLSVVERGSGYTTLFLLAALAENAVEVEAEAAHLRQKSLELGDADTLKLGIEDPVVRAWYAGGGKACAVDPGYYLSLAHAPHLYTFEAHDEKHAYTKQLTRAVSKMGAGNLFTLFSGCCCLSARAIPEDALPVNLAWNDEDQYWEFFEELWPILDPSGGLMIFHNTAAVSRWWDCMKDIVASRREAGDLEVLTLVETHKLNQNSCTIFRKTTSYVPSYLTQHPDRISADTKRFMRDSAKR